MFKFSEFLLAVFFVVLFGLLLAIFALDWVGGCGEVYEYANGTLHLGECIGRDLFDSFIKEVLR